MQQEVYTKMPHCQRSGYSLRCDENSFKYIRKIEKCEENRRIYENNPYNRKI